MCLPFKVGLRETSALVSLKESLFITQLIECGCSAPQRTRLGPVVNETQQKLRVIN